MRNKLWICLAFAALGAGGCAADSMEASDSGGQTGSLLPPCLVESDVPYIVPEGDTAFVQQSSEQLAELTLFDDEGAALPIETTVEGATSIVRTTDALAAGNYHISSKCQKFGTEVVVQRDITVVEAAPLPTEFGTLGLVSPPTRPECGSWSRLEFIWTPSPEFLSYLSLTQLTLLVDGVAQGVVALERPLEADELGVVHFELPTCPQSRDTCGPTEGEYSFVAKIAGETGDLSSPPVNLDGLCLPEEPTSTFCAMNLHPRNQLPWWIWVGSVWILRRARRCATLPRV